MPAAAPSAVDLAPLVPLALLALALGGALLAWLAWRQRGRPLPAQLAALTALTLFLTFDLVVFGAFTRLADAGLGCPDWPGCYGQASPFGARAEIAAAQADAPGGPVTWSKAWIEMIHRYLAMTVGLLIVVAAVAAWAARRRLPLSPWWPTATLAWVLVQGAFGKYTVTLKLYPAVVTLHLLGGLVLLVLLARQHAAFSQRPLALPRAVARAIVPAAVLLALQVALGGWVSSNYAVLACTGFPQCNGQWWPSMDWRQGFTLLRALGEGSAQGGLTVQALVAVHMAHRLGALAAAAALAWLALALWRLGPTAMTARRFAWALAALLALQIASGLSNVVLGWPLVAALGHSAGAAGLTLTLALLAWRTRPEGSPPPRIAGPP